MKRGDIVTVALQGDHGKPRPALVIQSDRFNQSSHVAVLLLTSFAANAPLIRIAIEALETTGLTLRSYVMLDRITTAPRDKVRAVIGCVDAATLLEVTRSLAVYLGFG